MHVHNYFDVHNPPWELCKCMHDIYGLQIK